MSSANKNNILKEGQKRVEKEELYPKPLFEPTPMFDEAGKGYAWIMLNFDALSDDNKDLLFSLEERKGKTGERIGEKAIWFVHPCEMGNLEFDLRVGKYDYDFLRSIMPEEEIPKNIEVDKKLIEFEKRHIVLGYNYGIYPTETVILRMPISEKTTVQEVEEYFVQFAKSFKSQLKEKVQVLEKQKEPETR